MTVNVGKTHVAKKKEVLILFGVKELGTDIKTGFNFENGDLKTITDKENLVQAITNRLNTTQGTFDLFYNEYGGILHQYHNWKANEITLKFMEIDIRNILNQDPRLKNYDLTLKYTAEGAVKINITLIYDDLTDLSLSFVLNENGVTEDGD